MDNITMEIINSEQFKRANLKFSGKPSEEIRNELKNEGWLFSRNHGVWYPKNDAAENSLKFAEHIQNTYFNEAENENVIKETSELSHLIGLIEDGASLNEVFASITEIYGEKAVDEAFATVKNKINDYENSAATKTETFLETVDPKALEIAIQNTENGDYIHIQQSDEYGWDYTSYNKDYKEIDGGVADDLPETKETEDIRVAAKAIIKDLYPDGNLSDWNEADWDELQSKIEEVEAEAYQKLGSNKEKQIEDHNNGVEQARDERESAEMNAELARLDAEAEAMERANGIREMEFSTGSTTASINENGLTKEQKEIRIAQSKLGDIVRETFLALSDEEKEAGTTVEQKNTRYEKWFRPMVDEIMSEIGNGNKDVMEIVNNFDLNHEAHVQGNKWYSPDEAYTRDVQYKLLPEMYEKVQDRIKAEYEANKTPYVIMYSSESPLFPSENKVYTVKEFNEKLLQADSEFHNRKKYAEEKYGSADNYWNLERDDKLPEEDKGIQFGYDKTNFKFFNIPNPRNPEDTFSYEPSRYDIGDGNGSVFDYVRSTCSHDEFISALNALETQIYFPGVTESQRQFVEKTIAEETKVLKANLKENMESLDKAQNEYKELHKKWLIEATEADRVDEMLKVALDNIKNTYDSAMNDVFTKVLAEYPFAAGDISGSEFLKYTVNEAKKMAVSELYLPSREAQKAMNAEDYKTYNSVDWAKLRRIWEKFPANVNMSNYAEMLLMEKIAGKGLSVADISNTVHEDKNNQSELFEENDKDNVANNVSNPTELSQEDIEICKKVIPPSQFKFTMELTEGEEGEFFKNKMKEIADTYRRINVDKELINEDGTHNVGFRYFLGDTEIFLSEIDSDGIGFGYNILNGDLQMSEWGSTSLQEILSIPYMEMDYHVPAGATIESMLYKEHPEYFSEYAKYGRGVKENRSTEQFSSLNDETAPSETSERGLPKDDKGSSKELSWGELEVFFAPAKMEGEDLYVPDVDFERTRKEVEQWAEHEATFDVSESERKKETVDRALWSALDFHNFIENAEKSGSSELSASAHEECSTYSEEIASMILSGEITSLENAQIYLNDKLLHSEVYEMVKGEDSAKESKPYNFFVSDTANLDLGIGEDFEPVLGLTAEQAAVKYAELKDKGLSPYIGLNIPGDFIFDDKEGRGAGIFCEIESDGKPSFYIGDNFVKDLKANDEHAKNVLAAYKDLYEMTNKYILGVVKPDFVFEKEEELNHLDRAMDGTLNTSENETASLQANSGNGNDRTSVPLQVYTFSPFGYEGHLVQVETDLRRGIPAYDIVGLADSAVKETRERIRYAFSNSGLGFPSERVLQSLSPADLRKDAPMDLSMALGILGQTNNYPVDEPVLALGELELSGNIRPVRGAVAAVNTAKASGVTNIVCDPTTAELLKEIDGINVLTVSTLKEANEKLMEKGSFQKTEPKLYKAETVEFNDEEYLQEALKNLKMDGHFGTIRAIEIAVAGKHNILATGAPGCGKTLLTQTLMPALTPKLTEEEAKEPRRIASLAGLDSPRHDIHVPPFRMPHQTATIEGICGGGPNCRPGEISLAHKGTLFMDETAEFRSSVIQMLRVPLESRQITLSRAGRSTSYPADFQLAMAMNPCPCGCFGSHDKICLDSARSIEQYWKKISDPLLDRVEIKTFVQKDERDSRKISIDEMKAQIATAFEIQRKRGIYNSHMTPEEIQQYCKLDKEGQAYLDKEEDKLTPRGKANLLKLSLTIANMDGREDIRINDLKEARELSAPVFEKPNQFVYQPEEQKVNVSINNEGYLSKPVDNFLELLTSTTEEKAKAHVFNQKEATKQIEFLNQEQKTWGTENTFQVEKFSDAVHEEMQGYKKDDLSFNYPNLGKEASDKSYKTDLRGGARVGSGRPKTGNMTQCMTLTLSILQSEELKRRARKENLSVSNYLAKVLELDKADVEEINDYLNKAKNRKAKLQIKPVENSLTLDDTNISRSQIEDAEKERSRITEPVLNGERTGMYKAFKDFEDKGVFDIQGTQLKLAKNGGLTNTGWKQLQAAMEIYRSKKFETFRYIMIDRQSGEIADQLAITSHMPNFCNVSKPNDETLKQVISRAEDKDYLIAVCHNHPSGNTSESSFDRELTDSLDRSLRRNDGLNRFVGHIILDHDTFNLATPSNSKPGNCHWKKMEPMQVTEIDRFTAEPKPEWAGNYVGGTSALKEVAQKINDTENWNDEFIPVVFTNADRNITGVQYYSKNFFENESDKIRNEFQFAAMEAGAIGAFPVVTDSLWEKLGKDATDFEALMKAHVLNDAFTDVAFNHTTMTEKYDIEAGRNYYSFYRDQSDRKIDVVSTWTPEVNPRLFPPEGVGQTNEKEGFIAKLPVRPKSENTVNYVTEKIRKQDFDIDR